MQLSGLVLTGQRCCCSGSLCGVLTSPLLPCPVPTFWQILHRQACAPVVCTGFAPLPYTLTLLPVHLPLSLYTTPLPMHHPSLYFTHTSPCAPTPLPGLLDHIEKRCEREQREEIQKESKIRTQSSLQRNTSQHKSQRGNNGSSNFTKFLNFDMAKATIKNQKADRKLRKNICGQ